MRLRGSLVKQEARLGASVTNVWNPNWLGVAVKYLNFILNQNSLQNRGMPIRTEENS